MTHLRRENLKIARTEELFIEGSTPPSNRSHLFFDQSVKRKRLFSPAVASGRLHYRDRGLAKESIGCSSYAEMAGKELNRAGVPETHIIAALIIGEAASFI